MALSVTESSDLNILATWILGPLESWDKPRTDEEALDALANLAHKAHQRLSAGVTDKQVFERWPTRQVHSRTSRRRYCARCGHELAETSDE